MPGEVAVCVPVRNERALLPALLEALARQAPGPAGLPIVCLHFDGCTDGSERLAVEMAAVLPYSLRVTVAAVAGPPNAGRARGEAMASGAAALAGSGGAVLLTTDADTVPADDWIAASCAALAQADVVAGRVMRSNDLPNPVQDRVELYLDRLYDLRRMIDPVPWEARPAHHYTAGASLAFRFPVYQALGGFAPHAAAEDARIVDAAYRDGHRVRRDRRVTVTTSSRRTGRVRDGLADHLRALDTAAGAASPRVGHPADAAWQYRGHALARAAHAAGMAEPAVAEFADRIGRTAAEVRDVADSSPNAEAFAMRVVPAAPGASRLVSLAEAECALAEVAQDVHEPSR